ncbi:MAG: ROK family protein [Bryobacteraceae bacterium]
MVLQVAGIEVNPAIIAPLDRGFLPASLFSRKYRELAAANGGVPLRLALERGEGAISTFSTMVVPPQAGRLEATLLYVERIVKALLWQRGGWKVYVGGPEEIGNHIKNVYSPTGARKFDHEFMGGVYEHAFEVVVTTAEAVPEARESAMPLGRHLDGCRVGFDLGASDRKASAVINGETVFTEEVVWDPRNQTDPEYHYRGVMDSIQRAASYMPRLDAVGGSAAGVYINNRVAIGSLYRGIPKDKFAQVANMFFRIREELGVPMEVVNDGEVTALAGSMSLKDNPVLGIALGSSTAAGYANHEGNITSWLNELAFVPIDYRADGPVDEWSGDAGCGVQYFSQQGSNRVATGAGMQFEPEMPLPERLVVLQKKMAAGDPLAHQVYETLGTYLGYGIAHFADFYELKHVLILGRVTTGLGGEVILKRSLEVLRAEFPELAARVSVALPDEANRRVGQSIAAASLPAIQGGKQ